MSVSFEHNLEIMETKSFRKAVHVVWSCWALVLFTTSGMAANLDEWTLQSQQHSLSRIARSSDALVAVGNGILLRSTNAADWIPVGNATSYSDVTCGNGVFVALSPSLYNYWRSSNSVDWTMSGGTSDLPYGVSFLEGRFLAVGRAGAVIESTNGIHWTSRPSGTTRDLYGVAFGNGQYVAVGDNTILSSPDGLTWTNRSPTGAGLLRRVAFGAGKFVAIARNQANLWLSTDGSAWSPIGLTLTNSMTPELASVSYVNGHFMSVGSASSGFWSPRESLMITSADGSNWTQRPTVKATNWSDSVFWDDTVVVVGQGIMQSQPFIGPRRAPRLLEDLRGRIALEGDAVTFSVTAVSWPRVNFEWLTNGQYFLVAGNTSSVSVAASPARAVAYRAIAINNGGRTTSSVANLTVVGKIASLPASWPARFGSEMTLGVPVAGKSEVAYRWRGPRSLLDPTNSTLALTNIQPADAGSYGVTVTNSEGAVETSFVLAVEPYEGHPLYQWNPSVSLGYWSRIAYGNKRFVVVGEQYSSPAPFYGRLISSEDGEVWRYERAPDGQFEWFHLQDVTFGNGVFVALGYRNHDVSARLIYNSTNGTDWLLRYSTNGGPWDQMVFRDGFFLVKSVGGHSMRSADGIQWESQPYWWGEEVPSSEGGLLATLLTNNTIAIATNLNYPFVTWTPVHRSIFPLSDVAFGNGVLVAVGGQVILRSDPLTRLGWDSSQNGSLAVRGLVGRQYAIEHREALGGTNGWQRFATITLTNNPALVPINPALQPSNGFFRAALLP